jgi:plastocyanin
MGRTGQHTLLRMPHSLLICALLGVHLHAAEVTAKVRLSSGNADADPTGVVMSLSPLNPTQANALREQPVHATLVQKNKEFSPHLLVIPPGSTVEFPNRDPFFHNVFSLFEGKKFDLGLYESGSSRSVKFDRAGVSYIFCNIHPQMNAIVISLATPYYAIAGASGRVKIPEVAPGEYLMQVWAEGLTREDMDKLSRRVTVSESAVNLGNIEVPSINALTQHKNKYGRGYDRPDTAAPYEPR